MTLRAGLWEEYLLDQLLWEADTAQFGRKSDIFPSWSWASISSKIMFPDIHRSEDGPDWLAEIIPSVESCGKPQPQTPYIHLRAPLLRAVFRRGCNYKLQTSKGASWFDDGSSRFELANTT
jgi:hypothetical protein